MSNELSSHTPAPKRFTLRERDSGLVEIAQTGARMQLQLAEELLGGDHPYVAEKQKQVAQTEQSVAITAGLFDETIEEWGGRLKIKPNSRKRDASLRNLTQFDWQRLGVVVNICSVAERISSGTRDEGKVPVTYELANEPGTLQTAYLSPGLVRFNLQGDGTGVYEGYRDARVPFDYFFSGDIHGHRKLLPEAYDLIAMLYNGEPIPQTRGMIKKREPILLTEAARREMNHLGVIVFDSNAEQFVTDEIISSDERGTIVAPLKVLPSVTNKALEEVFTDIFVAKLEHETKHVEDFRTYNGVPNNMALLEIRGLLSQMRYHAKYRQKRRGVYLRDYLDLLDSRKGEFTHIEEAYLSDVKTGIQAIPPEKADKMTTALQQSGYQL